MEPSMGTHGAQPIIAHASAGRALRGLRVAVAHRPAMQDRRAQASGQLLSMDSSTHILLEPPQGVAFMGPREPATSFVCCFSSSQESLAFREDVSSKGWTAALSLHTDRLLQMFGIPLGSTASAGFTGSNQASNQSRDLSTHRIQQVCFTHCLFVPKKSFQIPATAMRLSQDALAHASQVHNSYSAGEFLNTYHSHVSKGLHLLGGIFFHELTIRSEEHTTLGTLIQAAESQIKASFGISLLPFDLAGIKASGGFNASHNSAPATGSSCKVEKTQELILSLGPASPVQSANDFLLKLEKDPFSWAIIDIKEPCQADNLVSVWEIILQQPTYSSSDIHAAESLKQSARYMSMHWQDEVSCASMPHPIMLSQLLQRNSTLLLTTLAAPDCSAVRQLQPSSSFGIQQLPPKIPLAVLSYHLRMVLSCADLEADTISRSAATVVKSCISQVQISTASDEQLLQVIMSYGFDHNGNLLTGPLSAIELESLIEELEESQREYIGRVASTIPVTVPIDWLESCSLLPADGQFSAEGNMVGPSYASIKYVGDVVVDRPFLISMGMQDATLRQQALRLLDCFRHRVDPMQRLSLIRGENHVSAMNESWSDDDDDQEEQNKPQVASPFELLIEILKSSDFPSQVALYKLLLEQRWAVPLLHPDTSSNAAALGKGIEPCMPLKHYVQALSFVEVKLPKEEKVFITEDVELPRVVFLSKRKVADSASATVASKALSCNFMSQYYRADMGRLDVPVVELGLGFVRPGQLEQAGQADEPLPCLAFHVNGPCDDQLMKLVYDVADVIVLELDSRRSDAENSTSSRASSRPIKMLQWVDDRQEHQDRRNRIISGGETYIVNQTEQFLRFVLGKLGKECQTASRRKGIGEVCICHFPPSKLITFEEQEKKLCECDFTTAKQNLPLQPSFMTEARSQFELLKLKHRPAEARMKEKICQEEKNKRSSMIMRVAKHPLIMLLLEQLSRKDASERRVGMMWLERAIAEKMQPLMNEAAKKKNVSFQDWQRNVSSVQLRERHKNDKQDYVDKMLGVGDLWRELCHIFGANPKSNRKLATLAARHLLDAFTLEILDGDACMFYKEWVLTVLAELEMLTKASPNMKHSARIFVLSVMGPQSSGKSTLLNLMFGTQLHTGAGRCTRGVYMQLVKSDRAEYDYVLVLDTEGIRSPEFHGLQDSQLHDNRLATFGLLPADASVFLVSNEDDSGLKEVLPMVLLAFKGSAIAERYGGRIRPKMVFVYRSVDINDKKKLKENKEKLQEHLMKAAEVVANMGLNSKSTKDQPADEDEASMVASATSEMLRSMFNEGFCVDDDDEKSDVKCMGNLKRGHIPPHDTPEWTYGKQVIDLREYLHKRVTAEKGFGTGLTEWGDYLSMVWDCICGADFDLSFKTAVEVRAYKELQDGVAGGPRLELSKKFMEEFEKMEVQVRSTKEGEDTSSICRAFENSTEGAVESVTAELHRMLKVSMWTQWKAQEQNKWESFCMSLRADYQRRLDDMISGVVKFDNVVSEYERKMKEEIVELIEAGKLKLAERDTVFEGIFDRILNEARRLHEPFATRVSSSVIQAYGMSELNKKFQLHNRTANSTQMLMQTPDHASTSDMEGKSAACGNFVTRAVNKIVEVAAPVLRLQFHTVDDGASWPKEMQMQNSLDGIVDSQLTNVKKYDELTVLNVIKLTTGMLDKYPRSEQERGHGWVMNTLITKLESIQSKWDETHNVAEKLKAAKPQLRAFFEERANGVGAASTLIFELQNLLEDQLQASHHELLVSAVVDNLANKNWVINWEAMRACTDLHLLSLVEKENTQELFSCVEDGCKHFLKVTSALIAQEIIRLYKAEWKVFFKKVQRCLQDAGQGVSGLPNPSGEVFLDELRTLLGKRKVDRSSKLATSIVSRIYLGEQHKELDGDFFSTKVPQLCERLEERFGQEGDALDDGAEGSEALLGQLIEKVRERMEQMRDKRVTPRCRENCPRCRITCFREVGHIGRHDTVHQPAGLAGRVWRGSRELLQTSCWQSLERGDRFLHDDGQWRPIKDFEKVHSTWYNPSNHDITATQVREYIFHNFQPSLTAYFNAKITEKRDRVKECPSHKMPEYNHSLERLHNALHNRLRDSYGPVASALQSIL